MKETIKYYCERLLVCDESNLYGYLDCQGEEIIKAQFVEAGTFENGIAGTSEGRIDLDGNLLEDEDLEKIKRYKLKEEDQWDLLKVPFDVASEELMNKFLEYVEEVFVAKAKEITKPECFTGNLDDLEIYYQKINMYYSFSKIFNLKFDVDWVYSERLKVSEDINEILVKI